jgi:hypothetical protein
VHSKTDHGARKICAPSLLPSSRAYQRYAPSSTTMPYTEFSLRWSIAELVPFIACGSRPSCFFDQKLLIRRPSRGTGGAPDDSRTSVYQ